MAKEIPIPKELEILNRELHPETVVIGSKAYEILAMPEGDLEKIIGDIVSVMDKINSPNGKCPKCGKIVENALGRGIFKCPDDEENLLTMNESPVEAIIGSSKLPKWVEVITGIPEHESKANMTYNQLRHFAGVFWKQNFSDEGLPEASLENFQKLLGMLGLRRIPTTKESPAVIGSETKISEKAEA